MNYLWVYLSFAATLTTAVGVIILKHLSTLTPNVEISMCLIYIIMAILAISYLIIKKNDTKNYVNNLKKELLLILIIIAFLFILNNLAVHNALKNSPNIGYCHLIINLNIIITLLAGFFLYNQNINLKTFAGVIITLIGVSIVVYYSDD
jgi:drug/metabolite transporter (DMT)-like permease